MHLGMAVLMNATIALEDPFATDGVDGIYVEEIFYEVHKVLLSWLPALYHLLQSLLTIDFYCIDVLAPILSFLDSYRRQVVKC